MTTKAAAAGPRSPSEMMRDAVNPEPARIPPTPEEQEAEAKYLAAKADYDAALSRQAKLERKLPGSEAGRITLADMSAGRAPDLQRDQEDVRAASRLRQAARAEVEEARERLQDAQRHHTRLQWLRSRRLQAAREADARAAQEEAQTKAEEARRKARQPWRRALNAVLGS